MRPMARERSADRLASGSLWEIVEDQEIIAAARRDGVGPALIVTELDPQGFVVELLDDRADLSPGQPVLGEVRQQSNHVQERWPFALRLHR